MKCKKISKIKKLIILFCIMCLSLVIGFLGGYFYQTKKTNYRTLYAKNISDWPKPLVDEGIEYEEMRPLDSLPPIPDDNPFTQEKRLLGEFLFEEPLLSKSAQIACSSCHNKELGFGDGLKTSFGHDRQRGNRNAPSIYVSGFYKQLFWDGRANTLEEQAIGPIENPIEMACNVSLALQHIKDSLFYQNLFLLAFGESSIALEKKSLLGKAFVSVDDFEKLKNTKISQNLQEIMTTTNLLKAIATYERSLTPTNSRFNRFLNGDDKALSDQEIYGLHLFRTKGKCMNCHYGMILSDSKFHNIGLSFYGRKLEDLGRYEITKDEKDKGAFKTPSLISISKTAPYMHNGIFPHLRGVLNMYNIAFGKDENKQFLEISPLIHKLGLDEEELQALESFLKTL
ncbi:cytochrome-c peroxidase [Helicobacter sp. faydin-H20]|uniref:cytochrome-c peroxidase n=1 Tax=Helicobacter anatolicus TaxID=2905874 RepID=UPI001E57180A|nr:cytochrome c peroxidase [Helicobacter anatolicus]MCE3037101.1 cytochrome-c peroxidase [Helicobacter anatolicus]